MQGCFDGGEDLIVHVDRKDNVNNSDVEQQKCVSVCLFLPFKPAATNKSRADILGKDAIDIRFCSPFTSKMLALNY